MEERKNQIKEWAKTAVARIKRTIDIYLDCNMSVYAGNSTLFIITAVFPFLMLLISVVNLLPGYSPDDVAEMLCKLLPDLEPVQTLVKSIVRGLKDQSGGLLASAAAVTTLWSASLGVNAIQKGLNQLANCTKGGMVKRILKRLLFTLMMILLFPAILIIEMLGDNIGELICDILDKLEVSGRETIEEVVSAIFSTGELLVPVIALMVILLIYAKLPSRKITYRSQIPGTLVTGVCWYLFTQGFAYVIPRFYHASSLYGSLAALFLFLLWIRIMIMILFAGGAFNRALEEGKGNIPI